MHHSWEAASLRAAGFANCLCRAWVLVFGSDPVRAYLFDGGVVVYGQRQERAQGEGPSSPSDLIVNLWRQDRAAADPWSLHQLWKYLDGGQAHGARAASQVVWQQMQLAVAASVAAAMPGMRRASAGLPGYQAHSSGFAVFGADFVLDATLKPWLIEMNALPSLARKVIADDGGADTGASSTTDAPAPNPFDEQKQRFVRAMLQILLARHAVHMRRQQQPGGPVAKGHEQGAQGGQDAQLALEAAHDEAAAAAANGFAVLTPLVYQALGCLAADGSNATCSALGGLQAGMPSQAQCAAPDAQGSGWLDSVRAWLGHALHFLPRLSWGAGGDGLRERAALLELSEMDLVMASAAPVMQQ